MKLSEVGERAIVEFARKTFRRGSRVRIGIGDDAAAIDIDDCCLIATTDMLVASIHFPPETRPELMGRKSVVANLSDLAAMGAEPLGLIFSVALPRELNAEFVKRIMRGMESTAREYGTYVVGGDMDESKEITIAGAAFGLAGRDELMRRSEAKEGDILAVTGEMGSASAGLKILLKKLPSRGYRGLVEAQTKPKARLREGMVLARRGLVKAATDITDGLASSLWQMARESKVGMIIERKRVPTNPLLSEFSERHDCDVDEFALFGGEDFELLFAAGPRAFGKARKALKRIGSKATPIGRVTGGREVLIKNGESTRRLEDRGYEHFR